jgi:hypothetical protein
VLHSVTLEIDANFPSLSFRTERISATVETMTISRCPSYLHSHDPDLPIAFYNHFRESRESFGVSRERQVLDLLGGDMGWKRLNKPWFKRNSLTEVIYRRSPTTRLSPNGRVTVCIPYRLTFVIAVSHDGFNGPCIPTRQTAD